MQVPYDLSSARLARRAADLLLSGDRERNSGRDFDNCFEMDDSDAVLREFMLLYWDVPVLRSASLRSMGQSWIDYIEGLHPLSAHPQTTLTLEEDVRA